MLIHFNDANDISASSGVDALHLLEEQSARRERLGVSIAVASLGLLALIWLGLLGHVLWQPQAGGGIEAVAPARAAQCVAVADDQSRLDCYDRGAGHADPWPAKGARAPLIFRESKAAPSPR